MKIVEETEYGVYILMLGSKIVANEDSEYLSISAKKGDLRRIQELLNAAKSYGIEGARPVFLPGHRKIDQEEYEKQRMRMEWGLVPDEYDIGTGFDAIRNRKLSK